MTHLQAGDKAPRFTAFDQHGNKVSLAGFKGKKLALYFYPQDLTAACTTQACNLRDHYSALQKAGIAVVGVSPDTSEKHLQFEAKHQLPFPLITDPEHKLINLYGVWREKQLYGRKYMGLHRTTFLINEKGIIERVFLRPKNKAHAEEILSQPA